MDWYPQQLFTSRRRPQAFFFEKVHLFWKGTFWSPQALFTAEQAAAGACFWKTTCLFSERRVWVKNWQYSQMFCQYFKHLSIFVNVQYCARTYLLYGTAYGKAWCCQPKATGAQIRRSWQTSCPKDTTSHKKLPFTATQGPWARGKLRKALSISRTAATSLTRLVHEKRSASAHGPFQHLCARCSA